MATSQCIARGDSRYPSNLTDLDRPPDPLWARGDLTTLDRTCVAIVGTRRATPYAERVTAELGRSIALAGACVVSGLARGVDAAAHRAALGVGGATCAVLGTGLDVVFPKGHIGLQEQIGNCGLLLSELEPRQGAHRASFPLRNRIIAGLASVTIVVEGAHGSGALITARHALDLGRTVAAVPGPIDVPQSQGSNELIRDGAYAITCIADALALTGLTAPLRLRELPDGSAERRLWEALSEGSATLDALCSRAGLRAQEGMAAAATLELQGLVECALTGDVRRL